jgi:hypothetical protein
MKKWDSFLIPVVLCSLPLLILAVVVAPSAAAHDPGGTTNFTDYYECKPTTDCQAATAHSCLQHSILPGYPFHCSRCDLALPQSGCNGLAKPCSGTITAHGCGIVENAACGGPGQPCGQYVPSATPCDDRKSCDGT